MGRSEEKREYRMTSDMVRLEPVAARPRHVHHTLHGGELRGLAEVYLPQIQRAVVVLRNQVHVRGLDEFGRCWCIVIHASLVRNQEIRKSLFVQM